MIIMKAAGAAVARGAVAGDARIRIGLRCTDVVENYVKTNGLEERFCKNLGDLKKTLEKIASLPTIPSAAEYLRVTKYTAAAGAFENDLRKILLRGEKGHEEQLALFSLRIISSLERRMGYRDALNMIDVAHARVLTSEKLAGGKCNLSVDAGGFSNYYGEVYLSVISDCIPAACMVAIVPPKVVEGRISQGCIITTGGPVEGEEVEIGERPLLLPVFCAQALKEIDEFLNKKN